MSILMPLSRRLPPALLVLALSTLPARAQPPQDTLPPSPPPPLPAACGQGPDWALHGFEVSGIRRAGAAEEGWTPYRLTGRFTGKVRSLLDDRDTTPAVFRGGEVSVDAWARVAEGQGVQWIDAGGGGAPLGADGGFQVDLFTPSAAREVELEVYAQVHACGDQGLRLRRTVTLPAAP